MCYIKATNYTIFNPYEKEMMKSLELMRKGMRYIPGWHH
jgi:hypothetical protein